MLSSKMKLKIFFISLLKLLVALAVNSANASPKKNTGLLSETMKSKVYLKIRLKEYESLPKNCKKLYDNRGPYKIRKHCKKKISVIIKNRMCLCS